VVGEDLGSPPSQGVTEPDDLGHVVAGAGDDHLFHQQRRLGRVLGQLHVSHRLLWLVPRSPPCGPLPNHQRP
jgi:hypothetical protein